jgi:hypothetical protein
MRVFGCPAYVHVDKSQRRKLDDRAWKGVFVGYAYESPAWLVWNPATRRVLRSRNVVFDEASVLSMGESIAEQRNDDEDENIPRTMCSEESDTPLGESPLRESLQHSGSMENERDNIFERKMSGEMNGTFGDCTSNVYSSIHYLTTAIRTQSKV